MFSTRFSICLLYLIMNASLRHAVETVEQVVKGSQLFQADGTEAEVNSLDAQLQKLVDELNEMSTNEESMAVNEQKQALIQKAFQTHDQSLQVQENVPETNVKAPQAKTKPTQTQAKVIQTQEKVIQISEKPKTVQKAPEKQNVPQAENNDLNKVTLLKTELKLENVDFGNKPAKQEQAIGGEAITQEQIRQAAQIAKQKADLAQKQNNQLSQILVQQNQTDNTDAVSEEDIQYVDSQENLLKKLINQQGQEVLVKVTQNQTQNKARAASSQMKTSQRQPQEVEQKSRYNLGVDPNSKLVEAIKYKGQIYFLTPMNINFLKNKEIQFDDADEVLNSQESQLQRLQMQLKAKPVAETSKFGPVIEQIVNEIGKEQNPESYENQKVLQKEEEERKQAEKKREYEEQLQLQRQMQKNAILEQKKQQEKGPVSRTPISFKASIDSDGNMKLQNQGPVKFQKTDVKPPKIPKNESVIQPRPAVLGQLQNQ